MDSCGSGSGSDLRMRSRLWTICRRHNGRCREAMEMNSTWTSRRTPRYFGSARRRDRVKAQIAEGGKLYGYREDNASVVRAKNGDEIITLGGPGSN